MTERTTGTRQRATTTVLGALVVVGLLGGVALLSPSAGAAPRPVTGTAAVAIGFGGFDLGVPQTSTFTGTVDDTTGAAHLTVADTPLEIAIPLGADTYGFTGTFSNPGGFPGTIGATTATLDGTARFTLTGFTIPGVTIPPLLGILGCNLDFRPTFTGDHDGAAGTVTVSDTEITVPQFPALCAAALNLAIGTVIADFDINAVLAALPPASATLSLTLDTPLVTTTTSTSTSTSTSAPSTTTAPTTTAAPTTTTPATTVAPTTVSPSTSTTAAPTTTTLPPSSTSAPVTTGPGSSVAPSTQPPSTQQPTSLVPTTQATVPATTGAPTTTPPTVPTTAPASTAGPSTTTGGSGTPAPAGDPQLIADGVTAPDGARLPTAAVAQPVRATPTYTG